jgi:hypothetical protein
MGVAGLIRWSLRSGGVEDRGDEQQLAPGSLYDALVGATAAEHHLTVATQTKVLVRGAFSIPRRGGGERLSAPRPPGSNQVEFGTTNHAIA